jgi:hypothetical protein
VDFPLRFIPFTITNVFSVGVTVKITEIVPVLSRGSFAASPEWREIRETVHSAIRQAEWPVGAGTFTIYPESGKKSGMGNGVVPIKAKPMQVLQQNGWTLEYPWVIAARVAPRRGKGSKPGCIDAAKIYRQGVVVVEWETGNISSSHRAINKMALGLVTKQSVAGILVIPNMRLAKYLTDRIGNIDELRPYFPVWQNLSVQEGVLELVVIEQDDESIDVPRIPKGKDGRAAEGALAALLSSD